MARKGLMCSWVASERCLNSDCEKDDVNVLLRAAAASSCGKAAVAMAWEGVQ
jgi:hypothetical protein